MKYKVLTLTQPWATLVAIGAKRIETRSWYTMFRGPLLIHAAAGLGLGGRREMIARCRSDYFDKALESAGYWPVSAIDALPYGAIVAATELRGCFRIERDPRTGREVYRDARTLVDVGLPEVAFGDYTPGRFAWLLTDVRRLPTPIPAKGALGLWTWEGDLSL